MEKNIYVDTFLYILKISIFRWGSLIYVLFILKKKYTKTIFNNIIYLNTILKLNTNISFYLIKDINIPYKLNTVMNPNIKNCTIWMSRQNLYSNTYISVFGEAMQMSKHLQRNKYLY